MSTFIGKSAAPRRGPLYPVTVNTASLLEGAAVVWDSSKAGQLVKAPTAAGNMRFAGLISTVLGSSGTAVGLILEVQRSGIGVGLLKAGQSVTVGDQLVIAGTDGSLRGFILGSDDDCDIVGKALQTLTAGSNNDPLMVDLDAFTTVHKDAS